MSNTHNPWEFMREGDDDHLYDEHGNRRPLCTRDYVFPYGKYKGTALTDITDVGYLQWAKKKNDEAPLPDWFFDKIVVMRLTELQ